MTSFSLLVYRCHNDKPSIGYPRFELAGAKSQRPKTLVLLFLSCSYNFTTSITITSYFTFLIGSPRIVQYINICTFFMDAHASVCIYLCVRDVSLINDIRFLNIWEPLECPFHSGTCDCGKPNDENLIAAHTMWCRHGWSGSSTIHIWFASSPHIMFQETQLRHTRISRRCRPLRGALGFRINTSIEWIFDEIIFQRFS